MKFDPKKHGLVATTDFVRGTLRVKGGKHLTAAQIAALGEEGGQSLVNQRFASITDGVDGDVIKETAPLADIPADAGGGTVETEAADAERDAEHPNADASASSAKRKR